MAEGPDRAAKNSSSGQKPRAPTSLKERPHQPENAKSNCEVRIVSRLSSPLRGWRAGGAGTFVTPCVMTGRGPVCWWGWADPCQVFPSLDGWGARKSGQNPSPVRHLSSKEKSLTEAHLNFVGSQVAASRWLWMAVPAIPGRKNLTRVGPPLPPSTGTYLLY